MSDDAEIPLEHTGERRTPGRRAEDAAILTIISDSYRWFKRGPRILALLGGMCVGAAGVASWLGAQQSSPGQRISNLEGTVQKQFTISEQRVDTLAAVVDSLRDEVRANRVEQDLLRADLRLLLRLGCRPITDTDLRQDCVDRGARRR
jgi:hypothetical protein